MNKLSFGTLIGKTIRERNALIVYALRVGGALLAFILQVFLARWVGKFEYGIFAFTWSCVIILGEVLNFGFYHLIQRLIHEYEVKKQFDMLRGAIWGASGVIAIASTAITVIVILTLYLAQGTSWLPEHYVLPLIIGALSLPAFAFADYLSGIGRAHGWMTLAFAPTALFRPIVIISLLVGFLALGFGATATTAMIAATSAIWLTMILALVCTAKDLPKVQVQGPRAYDLKIWLVAALPMMLVSSFELMLFNVDVLMISRYLPTDQTGLYFAATKIMSLVVFLNFAVGSAFSASYALHHAANEAEQLKQSIRRSASLTFYPSLIMLIAIFVFKDLLLSFFGQAFIEASYVILPLSIGLVMRALVGPGERILMMTGQQYRCAAIYLLTVITDIILNIILIPEFGLLGAAIATAISFAQMSLLLLIVIWQQLDAISFTESPQTLLTELSAGKVN